MMPSETGGVKKGTERCNEMSEKCTDKKEFESKAGSPEEEF